MQKHIRIFGFFITFRNKNATFYFIICADSIIHILYFWDVCKICDFLYTLCILNILYLYTYTWGGPNTCAKLFMFFLRPFGCQMFIPLLPGPSPCHLLLVRSRYAIAFGVDADDPSKVAYPNGAQWNGVRQERDLHV